VTTAHPPAGVRTTVPPVDGATRVVLVRHGEAACNVQGVVGGRSGCTGLTPLGVRQVTALRDRLARTGELAGADGLYASVLPRALETAHAIAPGLDRWREGLPLVPVADCELCELHPGAADGLRWEEFTARYGEPDWERDPSVPLAPGGESWTGFVDRASAAVRRVADRHRGRLVVVVCHAGVVEATLLSFLPVDRARTFRGWVRVDHAAMTEWEVEGDRWALRRHNDATPVDDGTVPAPLGPAQQAQSQQA
jgi:probable phosphoglycerate mutase